MLEEQNQAQQDAVIVLEGEDGHSFSCQLLDVFDFEEKEYALLLNLGEVDNPEANDEEKGSLVIMRLTERDDQSIFQTIESEEEFDRVVAHVESMAKQAQAELSKEEEPQK